MQMSQHIRPMNAPVGVATLSPKNLSSEIVRPTSECDPLLRDRGQLSVSYFLWLLLFII